MKKLVILSVSLLLMVSCIAQPKKGKNAKADTTAPAPNPLKFEDSIVVHFDTTKVRIATYVLDGKYIGFQNGFILNKRYKLFKSQAEMENVTYFYSEKWVAIKPQDIFDVKQYKW